MDMIKQAKIVLRGEDGSTEHAQGMVNADNYADITLVERNRHTYVFRTFKIEKGVLVMFFDEVNVPVVITEF